YLVRAEMALLDRAEVIVQVDRVVRAGLHARAAADAGVAVDVHDAVGPFLQSVDRADLDARGVGAVVAAEHGEVAADVGITPLLDVLDRRAEVADGHAVLGFAGDGAGVAADAGVVVDEEAI